MALLVWWRRRKILRAWGRGTIDYAQARWRYERLACGHDADLDEALAAP